MALNLQRAEFVRSAAKAADFPRDGLPQVVFAGRSNVGKSSVINKILLRKNLARVGAAPGKTTHINYFLIDEKLYLVDLPGYGYAKVSQAEKERWGRLIESWFADNALMTLGIMVVDNKLDKLRKSEIEPNLARIRETLGLPDDVKVIAFSAEKGEGRQELLGEILKSMGESE